MKFVAFARRNAKTIVVVLVLFASLILLVSALAIKGDGISGIVTAIGYIAQSIIPG